jgi:capsid assembly protease
MKTSNEARVEMGLPPLLLPLGHSAWAIRPDILPRLIEAHRSPPSAELLAAIQGPRAAVRRLASADKRVSGAVAVIPLTGIITPRGSFLSMLFGGSGGGLMGFREQFADALTSTDIGAIVLDIDSPGGLVSLVQETAAEIRAARGAKPIVAVCNTLAASAAYWIATQADEVVCTPSGECGSVGVYMVHEDWSKFNADFGVEPTYISAGTYKTEGNPDEPLSKDGQKAWQQEVDDIYGAFLASVAAGRGISVEQVRANYGEGRCLLAARALEAGMCDRLDTLETVVGELLGQEPDAAEDSERGEARRLTVIVPSPKAEGDGQPRCQKCGKYLAPGETTCESCLNASDDEAEATAEDDKPESEPAADDKPAPADVEDDDEDEEDEDDLPSEEPAADDTKRRAALIFPG